MTIERFAVILAGGKGERFWPMSTASHPKQFLSLVGDKPLLSQAVERLHGVVDPDHVLVITNADLVEVARQAAPQLPPENVIGEPVGRDTAAAIALGAALIRSRCPEAVFCVLTADHVIGDLPLFRRTLEDAMSLAAREKLLLTIGLKPDYPGTGFGYIQTGKRLDNDAETIFMQSLRFVEKPDLPTAESYLASGDYWWNSGMFIWSVSSIQAAFAAYCPPLAALIDRLAAAAGHTDWPEVLAAAYAELDKVSIDYAVMEHADNVAVAKGVFSWDDVGSWPAVAHHFDADAAGNVAVGQVELLDTSNTITVSKGRLTALIGVKDLIVVQADGATLVCHKDCAQDIKALVQNLRKQSAYADLV